MKENTSIVSNVWFRQIQLDYKGDEYGGHSHKFDHMHLLCVGQIDLEIEGITTRFTAPQMIFIEKGRKHSMKAVSDKTLGYCIHPVRGGDKVEDIVDPESLPDGFNLERWLVSSKYPKLLKEVEDEIR